MTYSLFIGRFQPFHNGHLAVIQDILAKKETPLIVIGSAQKSHTKTNPLSAAERKQLIETALQEAKIDNYRIEILDDIDDYANWSNHIHQKLPPFDKIYTGSQLVKDCLLGKYSDIPPKKTPQIIHLDRKSSTRATNIRQKITQNDNLWEKEVPKSVAKLLKNWKIQERI